MQPPFAMIVIPSLSWNAAKKDTNHQNGKGRVRQRKIHQRKRVLNSLNLQIQPKPAKGVRTWDMSNRVGEISQE